MSITTWKTGMLNSTQYQGGGFKWAYAAKNAVTGWSAYVGSTVEVWEADGEKFVELDASSGNYGIKQPIKDAKAGGYVLTWRESGRNSDKAGDDPYCVRVYYLNDTTEVPIAQSVEFSGLDKKRWADRAFAFQITPEQFAAAKGTPIYVAYIPSGSSINTYGTLIDKVSLLPVDLKAHKRGTLNAPGAEVPAGTGEFGYETVMMENADSESSAPSTTRDCDESGAAADLNPYRNAEDDDLVKIVLKWPAGIKPAGASLKLLHVGMKVDATQTTADAAVSTSGPSRLNFYKADGTRITNPTTDLQIADLANAPASSYLSKILTDGEVTIFIEGADRFGDLPNDPTLLGGAQLKWEFTQGATTATAKLLVYRGGFLRFMQPTGAPGTVGDFEFWDGKGRVKNKVGKPIFGKEFETDVTDYGTKLATWKAKSGKTTGKAYNIADKNGHTPPGWWRQYRSNKIWTSSQQDKSTGSGATKKIEAAPENRASG